MRCWFTEMSRVQRLLGYTILSLITSRPLMEVSSSTIAEEAEVGDSRTLGHMNEEGAWCWREGCDGMLSLGAILRYRLIKFMLTDCLKLTKAMQKTSEALQTVADLYEDHVGTVF